MRMIDKLNALEAELQAIELWHREGDQPAREGEIEARRRRRLEILSEIDPRSVPDRDAS